MPYEPHFTITPKILGNMMEITEAITRKGYDGRETVRLRRINRLRSLQSSLAIEGNSLSLDEVTAVIDGRIIGGPRNEIKEVLNANAAYGMIDSIDPYSFDDLLKVHRIMMDGLVKDAGKLRTGYEGVFDGEGNCIYLAPGPDMVPGPMKRLLQWTKESDYPLILKSCVFHYGFEYIHPFEDGNGRMGRLWQTILLSKYDRAFQWVPVESMIRSYQNDYYNVIAASNSSDDCTLFIEFMTDMILISLKRSIEESLRDNIGRNDEMTVNEMRLYSMIRDGHYENIVQAAELMKVSVPTLNRCLKSLRDNGVIEKIGNRKTGKWIVVADEMMIDHTDTVEKE